MSRTAYRWCGDLFCNGCIVDALLETSPWSAYLSENETTDNEWDAEDDLNDIAGFFNINREDSEQVEDREFPVRIEGTPEPPDFCSGCLHWFS